MHHVIFLDGDIMKTATRSGHRLEDLNNLLHYILQCKRVQIDSGKLVSNWENLKDPCLPPSSKHFITRANKELVYALVRHLFNKRWNIFDSHLQEFVLTMFATVLRTLPERIKEFGENTLINVVLQKAFKKFKIGKETVNEWITAVKRGWDDDNISSLTTNVVLHKEIKKLRSEIRDLKQEAVQSHELQCEILNLLKNLNIGTVRSNSNGCPDIGVNGASDSGVIVQVNNLRNIGTVANTAGGADVVENVSDIGAESDKSDGSDINIISQNSNVKDSNNIVSAHAPGIVGPNIAPVGTGIDYCIAPVDFVGPGIAPVDFVGPVVGPGIASLDFVGFGVGPGIAPVDLVGSVSGDFGAFDISKESPDIFPDYSDMEADSNADIGNSLSLTVSIDHTIGTCIDTDNIFEKKFRGKGKNNKATKQKKTFRTGKPQ